MRELLISGINRKNLIYEKVQTLLLQCVYPEVVSFLKKNMDKEYLIQVLQDVGYVCADTIAKYWQPKGKTVQEMVRDIFKFIFDNKSIELKKSEKGNIKIIDKECRLCWEGLEEEDINYCISVSSFIQRLINSTRESFIFLPKIKVTTIQSKAAGADHCEHLIEFL